jgi:hypothetical protein
MRIRTFSKNLWERFFLVAEDIFESLIDYLHQEPDSKLYGKIFKLNIKRYSDEGEKIIGVKMFEDLQLYVLTKFEDTQITQWFLLENGNVEYSDSVSRIDLIMWVLSEVEANYKDENYWIDDNTGFRPPATE